MKEKRTDEIYHVTQTVLTAKRFFDKIRVNLMLKVKRLSQIGEFWQRSRGSCRSSRNV